MFTPASKIFVLVLLGGALAGFSVFDGKAVFLQSWESKTIHGDPVYNEIQFFPGRDRDVWMMNQSHHGAQVAPEQKDRLAIVIDKTQEPFRAQFLQLQPGPLVWEESLFQKQVEYRVSCFLCHNNGPRALRPDPQSSGSLLKIFAWNLRIKSYGRILNQESGFQHQKVPFQFHDKVLNETLNVPACLKCHDDQGFLSRGRLSRHQVMTIEFMVKNKQMPPPGFSITEKEKQDLQLFLNGF